jgi:hypothetical protein
MLREICESELMNRSAWNSVLKIVASSEHIQNLFKLSKMSAIPHVLLCAQIIATLYGNLGKLKLVFTPFDINLLTYDLAAPFLTFSFHLLFYIYPFISFRILIYSFLWFPIAFSKIFTLNNITTLCKTA